MTTREEALAIAADIAAAASLAYPPCAPIVAGLAGVVGIAYDAIEGKLGDGSQDLADALAKLDETRKAVGNAVAVDDQAVDAEVAKK